LPKPHANSPSFLTLFKLPNNDTQFKLLPPCTRLSLKPVPTAIEFSELLAIYLPKSIEFLELLVYIEYAKTLSQSFNLLRYGLLNYITLSLNIV
jgi:hypothetical protein